MSGKLIDYGIEWQRHDGFVGREARLDRLGELLAVDGADHWVLVTGGPVPRLAVARSPQQHDPQQSRPRSPAHLLGHRAPLRRGCR